MDLPALTDKLPIYPPNIQGELRLILQTKDIFMVCYRQLEEYRRLVNEQNRLITKEFVQEQLQVGEDEIEELKAELHEAETKLGARVRHNEILAEQLVRQGLSGSDRVPSARHLALVRSPQTRKLMLSQRRSSAERYGGEGRSQVHLLDNIALAIDEIHSEVRNKVKPLLDYYRDLFYLQLHFSIVLGQVCNYCMPLVTENIGLLERVFFWAERPEFELIRKASDISDRLKEIYTRAQQIYGFLTESVRFLQSKVDLQKSLETRFRERTDEQQGIKDRILRDIHAAKLNMDMLEEENDRLVGSLVKLDPNFVDSHNFAQFAEQGSKPCVQRKSTVSSTTQAGCQMEPEVVLNVTSLDTSNLSMMKTEVNNSRGHHVAEQEPTSKKEGKRRTERKREQKKGSERHEVTRRVSSEENRGPGKGSQKRESRGNGAEGHRSRSRRSLTHDNTSNHTASDRTRPQSEVYPTEKAAKASLKSRLLDRTKGLLDLSKIWIRDSEDSSCGPLALSEHPAKGDSVSTSTYSALDCKRPAQLENREDGKSKKKKKGKHKHVMRKEKPRIVVPEFEQLSLRSEDLLLLKDGMTTEESSKQPQRRRSKSRSGSSRNALAVYLTSSGSDGLTTTDTSVLPML
ncbi:unnamed protein product [Mesocestoides corti]|uniref:DUF5743 domain-containing protein n=1 Tax=Mesocestoides corti TaxID=53468 RepID=A0A0R3U7M0_MESCO|nr:unnamed protein product [Mesocestoides corti]